MSSELATRPGRRESLCHAGQWLSNQHIHFIPLAPSQLPYPHVYTLRRIKHHTLYLQVPLHDMLVVRWFVQWGDRVHTVLSKRTGQFGVANPSHPLQAD